MVVLRASKSINGLDAHLVLDQLLQLHAEGGKTRQIFRTRLAASLQQRRAQGENIAPLGCEACRQLLLAQSGGEPSVLGEMAVEFDCIVGCCVPSLGVASHGQADRLAVAENPIFQLEGCLSSWAGDVRLGVEILGKRLNVDGEHDADRCQQAREYAKADPEYATRASQAHALHNDALCRAEDAHPKHHECGSRGQSHAYEAGQLPEVDGPCGKSNQRQAHR